MLFVMACIVAVAISASVFNDVNESGVSCFMTRTLRTSQFETQEQDTRLSMIEFQVREASNL